MSQKLKIFGVKCMNLFFSEPAQTSYVSPRYYSSSMEQVLIMLHESLFEQKQSYLSALWVTLREEKNLCSTSHVKNTQNLENHRIFFWSSHSIPCMILRIYLSTTSLEGSNWATSRVNIFVALFSVDAFPMRSRLAMLYESSRRKLGWRFTAGFKYRGLA